MACCFRWDIFRTSWDLCDHQCRGVPDCLGSSMQQQLLHTARDSRQRSKGSRDIIPHPCIGVAHAMVVICHVLWGTSSFCMHSTRQIGTCVRHVICSTILKHHTCDATPCQVTAQVCLMTSPQKSQVQISMILVTDDTLPWQQEGYILPGGRHCGVSIILSLNVSGMFGETKNNPKKGVRVKQIFI